MNLHEAVKLPQLELYNGTLEGDEFLGYLRRMKEVVDVVLLGNRGDPLDYAPSIQELYEAGVIQLLDENGEWSRNNDEIPVTDDGTIFSVGTHSIAYYTSATDISLGAGWTDIWTDTLTSDKTVVGVFRLEVVGEEATQGSPGNLPYYGSQVNTLGYPKNRCNGACGGTKSVGSGKTYYLASSADLRVTRDGVEIWALSNYGFPTSLDDELRPMTILAAFTQEENGSPHTYILQGKGSVAAAPFNNDLNVTDTLVFVREHRT